MTEDTQFLSLLLSIAAFMVIVTVNVLGLHAVGSVVRGRPRGEMNRLAFGPEMGSILLIVLSFLAISVATNLLWGAFVYAAGAVGSYHSGVFFALENYTSLGLTRVQVDERWRTLAPLISLSGVFCLGWSTAVLVNVFNHLYGQGRD